METIEAQRTSLLNTFKTECLAGVCNENHSSIAHDLNKLFGSASTMTDLVNLAKHFTSDSLVTLTNAGTSTQCKNELTAYTVAPVYQCWTCSVRESEPVTICNNCFVDSNHTSDDHACYDHVLTSSNSTVVCDCGDGSKMKSTGWCTQHKQLHEQCSTAVRRIVPRLLSRMLIELRTRCNTAQIKLVCNLLVEFSRNRITQSVVWSVLCDTKWYEDAIRCEVSTADAGQVLVACAVSTVPEQLRACGAFRNAIASVNVNLGVGVRQSSSEQSEAALVLSCALDELLYWHILLDNDELLLQVLKSYCGGTAGNFEFAEAFLRQLLIRPLQYVGGITANIVNGNVIRELDNPTEEPNFYIAKYAFGDSEVVELLVHTKNVPLILSKKYEIYLHRFGELKQCELLCYRRKNVLSAENYERNSALVIDTNGKYLLPCLHGLLYILDALRDLLRVFEGAKLFIEESALADWLKVIEPLQGMVVHSRDRLEERIALVFGVEIKLVSSMVLLRVALNNSNMSANMRIDLTNKALKAVNHALLNWLRRIGLQYQPGEPINSLVDPNQLTSSLIYHRMLAILLAERITITDSQHSSLQASKECESIPSDLECYQLVQHPISALIGFIEVRNCMWLECGIGILNESECYCRALCDCLQLLDLELVQYCAAQTDPDTFLSLLTSRALHFGHLLDTRKHQTVEAKLSCPFESVALILIWILTEPRFATLYDEEYNKEVEQALTAALCVKNCTLKKIKRIFPKKGFFSITEGCFQSMNLVLEKLTAETANDNRTKMTLKAVLWSTAFDSANVLLYVNSFRKLNLALQRYFNFAGTDLERAQAAQRGVTIFNLSLPLHVPTAEQFSKFPTLLRPFKLLHSSTYYALLFAMLRRVSLQLSVDSRINEARNLLSFAVHLLRIAIAYQQYQLQKQNQQTEVPSEPHVATEYDEVDESTPSTWYPTDVCNNVYGCMVHKIATVKAHLQSTESDAEYEYIDINESILSLLVKLYAVLSQQDYKPPSTSGSVVKRDYLFAKCEDVIGAVLDAACLSSELVRLWFDNTLTVDRKQACSTTSTVAAGQASATTSRTNESSGSAASASESGGTKPSTKLTGVRIKRETGFARLKKSNF